MSRTEIGYPPVDKGPLQVLHKPMPAPSRCPALSRNRRRNYRNRRRNYEPPPAGRDGLPSPL